MLIKSGSKICNNLTRDTNFKCSYIKSFKNEFKFEGGPGT